MVGLWGGLEWMNEWALTNIPFSAHTFLFSSSFCISFSSLHSKEDPRALARRYEAEFWEDMRALNVLEPTAVVRVTEHIDAILAYVTQIQANGMAYQTGSGVYFDVAAFEKRFAYGKLRQVEGVQGAGEEASAGGGAAPAAAGGEEVGEGAVVGREEKKDRRDFVLW